MLKALLSLSFESCSKTIQVRGKKGRIPKNKPDQCSSPSRDY